MLITYIEMLGILVHVYHSYVNDPLRKETEICISTAQVTFFSNIDISVRFDEILQWDAVRHFKKENNFV